MGNMLFEGLSATAIAKLVPIVQHMNVEVNERLVACGEPGIAMFVVIEGIAHMSWDYSVGGELFEKSIETGDSFGEEIILGLEERYSYTVTATSTMIVHMIQEIEFQTCFQAMPDLL